MSTVSLEEFLAPISNALGRTEPPASVEPCATTSAPLASDFHDYTTEELSNWFIREAEKVGTIVKEAKPNEVAQAVIELVNQFGEGGHVVYADVEDIDSYQIPEALANTSLKAIRWDPTSREASVGQATWASPLQALVLLKPPQSSKSAPKNQDAQFVFYLLVI